MGLRTLLFGERLSSRRAKHERLPKWLALPVFASDALSSTAYATQEILIALVAVGGAFLYLCVPIAFAIAALLVTVAISYRQTIQAYPQGGGSFIVARENLGDLAGLTAASALLIDYVLTVAVSVAAGVEAITSAFPSTSEHNIVMGLGFIAVITVANLRGLRESGLLFAPPTYGFVFGLLILLGLGLSQWMAAGMQPMPPAPDVVAPAHLPVLDPAALNSSLLATWLILRAFASGCSALTGTEAVADGVQAFHPPEARNAQLTLTWMAVILTCLFMGTTMLASPYCFSITPSEGETVISQLARSILHGRTWYYYYLQVATAAILVLAANTAYSDFPRLSSILARAGFAPRQLANLGDRLVFSNGILFLGILASLLLVVFGGSTHHLIPLYAVGVFLSFTLSQLGMVLRWFKIRGPGWQWRAALNGMGGLTTGLVLLVIASVKFYSGDVLVQVGSVPIRGGAWMVLATIPVLIWWMRKTNHHYRDVGRQLAVEEAPEGHKPFRHRVVVLVPSVHRGVVQAVRYARSVSEEIEGLHVNTDPSHHGRRVMVKSRGEDAQLEVITPEVERLREAWRQQVGSIPLTVLDSEFRSVSEPIQDYLDRLIEREKLDMVTVVIPEFATTRWWHNLLHNQSAFLLKLALLNQPRVVVANVRYFLNEEPSR